MSQDITNLTKSFVLKIIEGAYKGKQLKLVGTDVKIGRANECDIIFKDDNSCSREHAQIKRQGDSFLIRSLNAKNPVLINNQAVETQLLRINDQIQIGQTKMLFLESSPVSPFVQKNRQKKALLSIRHA